MALESRERALFGHTGRLGASGSGLLAAIVIFNVLNIPLMFPQPGSGATLRAQPDILPAVILAQIIATWLAVWWLASPRRAASQGSRL